MGFLRFTKSDERPGDPTSVASLAVILLVCVVIVLNIVTHLPMMLTSLFIPVQHPLVYKFPIYAKLLPEIVKGDLVDYSILKNSKLLDEALSDLSHISPDSLEDEDQRFCFWINSYNMLILKAITEKYPVKNLLNPKLTRIGTNKYFIGGKPCSIEEIRKLQLVPRFMQQDPKAAFLCCSGCIGSPPLLDHVITPKTLKADGEEASKKFVGNKANVNYDPIHKTFSLSPFFVYNEAIFGRFGGPHAFANQNLPANLKLDLDGRDVLFKSYSQRLNTYLNDTALQNVSEEPKKSLTPSTK